MNDLENSERNACLAVGLFELDGRQRSEAWRLEDHRVAERERGRGLPAGDLQRVVPGADAGNDAERFAARVAEGLRSEVDVLAGSALRERREVLDAFGTRDHVDDTRLLDGLAGIAGFECRQLVVARAQDLCGRGAGCGHARHPASAAQAGCASRAAWTAASTSAGPAMGTSPRRSPVAGLMETRRSFATVNSVATNRRLAARRRRARPACRSCVAARTSSTRTRRT